MFANAQNGNAEAAINLYSSLFPESSLVGVARFEEGEPTPGLIKHAQFKLHNQVFMVMDAPGTHAFNFNEGLSLVVDCQGQEEVDHYWNGFTTQGEESSRINGLKPVVTIFDQGYAFTKIIRGYIRKYRASKMTHPCP